MYKILKELTVLCCLGLIINPCNAGEGYDENQNDNYVLNTNEQLDNNNALDLEDNNDIMNIDFGQEEPTDDFGITTIDNIYRPEGYYIGHYGNIKDYILGNYPILNDNCTIKVYQVTKDDLVRNNEQPNYYLELFEMLVKSIKSFSYDLNNGLYNAPEPGENATDNNYFLKNEIFTGLKNMFLMIITAILHSDNITTERKSNIEKLKDKYLSLFDNINQEMLNLVPKYIYNIQYPMDKAIDEYTEQDKEEAGVNIIDNPDYNDNITENICNKLNNLTKIFNDIKNILQ